MKQDSSGAPRPQRPDCYNAGLVTRPRLQWFGLGVLAAAALLWLLYQVPPVKFRLEWRLDAFSGIVRGWLRPGDTLPTPVSVSGGSVRPLALVGEVPTEAASATPEPQSTPAPTVTPIPSSVQLAAPAWEKQDWNNCGPATMALMLRMYGWQGDQYTISDLLKPDRGDKNVNVEELVYYVRTRAGWLDADFRVGGTLEQLKQFLAAGFPVAIEKGFILPENDGGGGWAGHYLLLTGYDQAAGEFTVQDTNPTTGGPDRRISYAELDNGWRQFNRVYFYVYLPSEESEVQAILGADLDTNQNRQAALTAAQAEAEANQQDPYAWFNLGTNLVYFERYGEASQAFDNALSIGLPWRFTRYQFGPYIAYFNQNRFQDVYDLADATLFRTYKSEEGLLWRGWASYRLGDLNAAIGDFREALQYNPNYLDAQYALDFVGASR